MTRLPLTSRLSVLAFVASLWLGLPAGAVLEPGKPLPVRILLDNSGSMYPGYRPEVPGGKSALGVRFFREYPQFRAWLRDFILRQSVLNAEDASLWVATSTGAFSSGDVRQVQPSVALSRVDVEVLHAAGGWGRNTYLKESLQRVSAGFEGLVWLITDNIVETPGGNIDQGIVEFYETLRDTPRYRSVHVFKLPFRDPWNGQRSDLAVYGTLVSEQEVDWTQLAAFDRKLQQVLAKATRKLEGNKTAPLFEEQQHLKLKDLRVAPFDLLFRPALEVRLRDQTFGFRESQQLVLPLEGEIRSNLGLHTVLGGQPYKLVAAGPFRPDSANESAFGLQPLSKDIFAEATGTIPELPPLLSRSFAKDLVSKEPIRLDFGSRWAWLKAGLFGVRAVYEGEVEMRFDNVAVRFEQKQLTGVFGSEKAAQVFQFRSEERIRAIPEDEKISFTLVSASSRGLVVLLLLLPVAIALTAGLLFLLRRRGYRVSVGEVQQNVSLRRLATYRVRHRDAILGTLRRSLAGHPRLTPEPGVELRADGAEGHFLATVPRVGSVSVRIEPLEARSQSPRQGRGGSSNFRRRRPESASTPARGGAGPVVSAGPPTVSGPPLPAPSAPASNAASPQRPRPTYRRPG